MEQRDWIYLLPDGTTAENMKEGKEILRKQTGHVYSGDTFANLVRKGVIKKVERSTHRIITQSDAYKSNSGAIPKK